MDRTVSNIDAASAAASTIGRSARVVLITQVPVFYTASVAPATTLAFAGNLLFVTAKEDFEQIVSFGDLLDYECNYGFSSFSLSESGEHLGRCWNICERFGGWFCFVIHAVKEVVFHVLMIHDYTSVVNYFVATLFRAFSSTCVDTYIIPQLFMENTKQLTEGKHAHAAQLKLRACAVLPADVCCQHALKRGGARRRAFQDPQAARSSPPTRGGLPAVWSGDKLAR